MTIETRKYHIIEQVMKIYEDSFLHQLERMLQGFTDSAKSISRLVKPMRKQLLVEDLIKEQNFFSVVFTELTVEKNENTQGYRSNRPKNFN